MTRGTLQYGGNTVRVWVDDSGDGVQASSGRPRATLPFKNLADKYRADVLPLLKPASQASIDSVLSKLCIMFGPRKLHAIGTDDIQKFITSSPYSPKTIKNHVGVMKMVWNKGRAWDYVRHDPFEFLSMPRAPLAEARTLSVDEVRAIIRKTDDPFHTMLWILAETGARGGELCGLFMNDVDLDARTIRISRSAFQGKLQTPKTGSAYRTIAISGQLAEHLSSRATAMGGGGLTPLVGRTHTEQHNRAEAERSYSSPLPLLFSTPNGRPWDNGEIVRRLKPMLGSGVGLHAFRHANASLMASIGVPEHIRRERLGHSGGGITARYTHSDPTDHRRWAEAIGQAICTENVQRAYAGGD